MQEYRTDIVILRLPDVKKMTGLPTSTLYYFMSRGEFPLNKKIGYRAVGWLKSDIESWIKSKTESGTKKSGEV